MQTQRAFTLIEMLFAIAVLIILISVAAPSYNQLYSRQALIANGERLYQLLRFASSESIKQNKKVYVRFCQKENTAEWRIALSEYDHCDCFIANSCSLNGVHKNEILSDGKLVFISVKDITFDDLRVSYSPMRFSVNAGSVTLSDNNNHKIKVIQSTMRIRICSPDGDQLGYKQC